MTTQDRFVDDGRGRAAKPRSRLFAVRLWTEEVDGGAEYRGNVRDTLGGAFRDFRAWSDLTAFMVERMEEDETPEAGPPAGGPLWPSQERR